MWVTNLLKVLRAMTDAMLSTSISWKVGFQCSLVSAVFRPYQERICLVEPDEPQAH